MEKNKFKKGKKEIFNSIEWEACLKALNISKSTPQVWVKNDGTIFVPTIEDLKKHAHKALKAAVKSKKGRGTSFNWEAFYSDDGLSLKFVLEGCKSKKKKYKDKELEILKEFDFQIVCSAMEKLNISWKFSEPGSPTIKEIEKTRFFFILIIFIAN
jgi:ribonuclease HI